MPRLRGGGVVLVAALLVSLPAVADPLDRAKAAIDQSDYFTARTALDELLKAGTSKPDEVAEIYKLSGYVAGALGDSKAAKAAFERCLALAPTAALPAGTSPKIIKSFTAAQDTFKNKKPLEVKTETTTEPPTVTIEVVSDPLKMIVKLEATFVVDGKAEQKLGKPFEQAETGKVTIDLPKGKRIDLRLAAIDEYGNRLSEVGSKSVPIVIVGKAEPVGPVVVKPKPKPVKAYKERPLQWRWWLWAGAGVVFLGAGSYFAIDAVIKKGELEDLGAESANHTFDEVERVESRARRDVLFANIGLIAGGAFAITAGVLYLTRPKQPTERRMAVTPTVHPRGAGVALGGSF
jgi:hypothetical protein